MVLIILLYLLFAITFTLAKAVLFYVTPIFFIGMRMSIAGVLLLGYALFVQKIRIQPKSWPLLAQIALFHVYVAYIAEFWALQYTSSAKTAIIYNFSPFITALLAIWFVQERLSRRQWAGLALGFVGFVPWIYSATNCEWHAGSVGIFSLPEIALIVSVISSAYGWLIMRKLLAEFSYSPILVNGIGMLCGGLLAVVTALAFETKPFFIARSQEELCNHLLFVQLGSPWGAMFHFILYTALLIIIANILCYNLYGYLLTRYSPTFLSFAGFLCPLFAALFGWFFLSEHISVSFIMTVICVIGGLLLFYMQELRTSKT